jgi:hypothetical protein
MSKNEKKCDQFGTEGDKGRLGIERGKVKIADYGENKRRMKSRQVGGCRRQMKPITGHFWRDRTVGLVAVACGKDSSV